MRRASACAKSAASAFGNSYAGAAAPGGEATTMFFNPALVADVKTLDISSSALGLLPDAKGDFTATTAAGTPAGGATHINDIVNTALLRRWRFARGCPISSRWVFRYLRPGVW